MFHRSRWVLIGVMALIAVGGWRLSFWNPHPIMNAQEVGDLGTCGTPKTAEETAQAERLKNAEPLSQFLKKLYPDMPLQVLPVGEAVLLRGDVWSQ